MTTPIYYVNDVPHVGHAYTTIAADVLARYYRLLGFDVFFLTGTDEHGTKVAASAQDAGKKPKQFCDEIVLRFIDAWKRLNIANDYFIRTTDSRHEKIVQALIQKAYNNGYVYKGTYKGLYCIGCEKFLTETDLVDNRCPLHPNRKPVRQKETNYFFKLSAFKDTLIKAIENKKDKNHYEILPEKRKSEILGKLKQGLNDVSISRASVKWGVPVPWDKTQTIYVWFDALLNYYTATKFVKNRTKFWPAELHLIGKDILWFHTVIWQAFLLAVGLSLPKTIFAHGYFTINGRKMSKSLGNVISPADLIKKFGIDGTRYSMLSEFPFGTDGDISLEKFKIRYNADLANGLGNLCQRVAALAENAKLKITNDKLFRLHRESSTKSGKLQIQNYKAYSKFFSEYRFNECLAWIWEKISKVDRYIDQTKPWTKKGESLAKLLEKPIREIQEIAYFLKPFLPETAEKIEKQFKGPKIKSGEPLFPRI